MIPSDGMKFVAEVNGKKLSFRLHRDSNGVTVDRDDATEEIDLVQLSPYSYSILVDNASHYLIITEHPEGFRVVLDQQTFEVKLADERTVYLQKLGGASSSGHTQGEVRAPIPGLITSVFVKPGQEISRGDRIAILEAMKMENEIQSFVSGTVKQVRISAGQSVERDALLISVAREDDGNR